MVERYYITPEGSYKVGGNYQVLYTPVVVVKGKELAHIYIAGRVARELNGDVKCHHRSPGWSGDLGYHRFAGGAASRQSRQINGAWCH